MDYSMYYDAVNSRFNSILFGAVLFTICAICASIFCIKYFIKKNSNVVKKIWFFNNRHSVFGFVGIIVSFIIVILLIIDLAIRIIPDIPNVINKDYKVTTGIVTSWDAGGTGGESRGIKI